MRSTDEATRCLIEKLEAKTGQPLQYWIDVARASGSSKHGEVVAMLKRDHLLGNTYAHLVTHQAFRTGASSRDGSDLVAAQYAGEKAHLRPIYDALLDALVAFGGDVDVSPKKAYVSVGRRRRFAIIQPTTVDRVDVGLLLGGVRAGKRLEPAAGFNASLSHRIRVTSIEDVDDELIGWLRRAYDEAG